MDTATCRWFFNQQDTIDAIAEIVTKLQPTIRLNELRHYFSWKMWQLYPLDSVTEHNDRLEDLEYHHMTEEHMEAFRTPMATCVHALVAQTIKIEKARVKVEVESAPPAASTPQNHDEERQAEERVVDNFRTCIRPQYRKKKD